MMQLFQSVNLTSLHLMWREEEEDEETSRRMFYKRIGRFAAPLERL